MSPSWLAPSALALHLDSPFHLVVMGASVTFVHFLFPQWMTDVLFVMVGGPSQGC